jgi:hypothetical protein
MRLHPVIAIIQLALLAVVSLQLPATAGSSSPLATLPAGDRWFSISMNEERVGFAHISINQIPDGYEIFCEGSARMAAYGFSREASSRERYIVNRDMALQSFAVEERIEGRPMTVSGEVTPQGIRMRVETEAGKTEKLLKTKGMVYPGALLNIYPLKKGWEAGKRYRLQMFDAEALQLKNVKIAVIGVEKLPDGVAALHLQNDLYPVVDNDIWVDLTGNTIRESVRNGLVVTQAADEQSIGRFLYEAALAGKGVVRDFSLVRPDRPLEKLSGLKGVRIELAHFPATVPLFDGPGQRTERLDSERVVFATYSSMAPRGAAAAPDGGMLKAYLAGTERLPAENQELVARKSAIIGAEQDPARIVAKLVQWVSANVRLTDADSPSPLETLKTMSGDCRAHVQLYIALASAAGIPTKAVAGLVYVAGQGFRYHSWAESYAGGWLAVDPTMGQLPVDPSHLKLVEGDTPAELAPLGAIIGRVQAKVLELKY